MKVRRVDTVQPRTPAQAAMAAMDVTRAEFEDLLKRVTQAEGTMNDVGDQFELLQRTFTTMEENATTMSSKYDDQFQK